MIVYALCGVGVWLSMSRALRVALFLALASASEPADSAGPAEAAAPTDPAEGVEPIDFDAAVRTASAAVRRGESLDEAVASAGRVLAGDSPFEPITALPGAYLAAEWLSSTEAPLLQHEVIASSGWTTPTDAPRELALDGELPPWADDLARKLTPALGAAPASCTVYACEAGQRAALAAGKQGAAVLSLHSEASL